MDDNSHSYAFSSYHLELLIMAVESGPTTIYPSELPQNLLFWLFFFGQCSSTILSTKVSNYYTYKPGGWQKSCLQCATCLLKTCCNKHLSNLYNFYENYVKCWERGVREAWPLFAPPFTFALLTGMAYGCKLGHKFHPMEFIGRTYAHKGDRKPHPKKLMVHYLWP